MVRVAGQGLKSTAHTGQLAPSTPQRPLPVPHLSRALLAPRMGFLAASMQSRGCKAHCPGTSEEWASCH